MQPIRIESIEPYGWGEILHTSKTEGHNMVNRLVTDFRAETNRFDGPGEVLLACLSGSAIVGIVGLNQLKEKQLGIVGLVRRLYVVPRYRGKGLGRCLVEELSMYARSHFVILTVNVGKLPARGFYEHLGFRPVDHPTITHMKELTNTVSM